MDALVGRVRRTVRRYSLIPRGSRVLVALSGGADSMALLHALIDMEQTGDCSVAGVAHLNHALRGAIADEDENFCRAVAAERGLPFECERVDVGALAKEQGVSVEAAGHEARYRFLDGAAARLGADRVALGHTRDDQAETFLLRLLRGAGPRGLGAMHPSNGQFVRPMLDCSRRQVRAFVRARGIRFREDSTNADRSIPRNLIRHDVLPVLEHVKPGIRRVLAREAAIARDDAEFIEAAARAAFDENARHAEGSIGFAAARLRSLPPAVARRVVSLAANEASGGRSVGFEHVERVLDLVSTADRGPAKLALPGQCVEFDGSCVLFSSGREITEPAANSFRFLLSIPGEVVSPFGWTLSAEHARLDRPAASYPRSWAAIDAARLAGAVFVRSWRPGDRLRPCGMAGTRKLQDVFVDRKVPRRNRGRVPVVVDAQDRVIWAAGHVIAEDFRATLAASDVVILKLKYWRHGT